MAPPLPLGAASLLSPGSEPFLPPDHLACAGSFVVVFSKPLMWNVLINCSLSTLGVPVSASVYLVAPGRAMVIKSVLASLPQGPGGAGVDVI